MLLRVCGAPLGPFFMSPHPFSVLLLFCALCYVCSRVAELQCCAILVGLIPWLLPLASGGLLLCGVVHGGLLVVCLLLWVGWFCWLLGFVGVWVCLCAVPSFCATLFTYLPVPEVMVREREL